MLYIEARQNKTTTKNFLILKGATMSINLIVVGLLLQNILLRHGGLAAHTGSAQKKVSATFSLLPMQYPLF
jgi:hypothetical protein